MEPQLKVSSNRLVKPEIEPATPGLQGQRLAAFLSSASMHTLGTCTKSL